MVSTGCAASHRQRSGRLPVGVQLAAATLRWYPGVRSPPADNRAALTCTASRVTPMCMPMGNLKTPPLLNTRRRAEQVDAQRPTVPASPARQ